MFTMKQPQYEDIMSLALNIRDIDAKELHCFSNVLGDTTIEQIATSINMSDGVIAVRDEHECVCIGGFSKQHREPRDIGVCWMVGTRNLDRHAHKLTRWAKMFLDAIASNYDEGCYNVIHRDNVKTIAWLKRLGCNIVAGHPLEIGGEPFTYFVKPNPLKEHSHV